MQYSYRSSLLSDSPTLAIAAKAKRLISEGIDIVSFSAGQPDFSTPEAIKAAGIEAIDKNVTGYTASSGTPKLRSLVAEWMTREVGVDYAPNQIIVSTGAKFALVAAILATVNPGDEVLFAAPYWVSYPEMVKLAGAEPRPIMTVRASGFKLSPEALESSIGRETKMLMLNSPNNPTGAVYSRAELEALADVLARHPDVWVLSDEIYSRLIFGGKKHVSIAAISPDIAARTIVINGVSKTFAMTGWRIGWAAGPAELISRAGRIQSHTTSCPNSIAQYAAERALAADDSFIADWVKQYSERRDLFSHLLSDIPGIEPFVPEGAFYLFCDIAGWIGKTTPKGKVIESSSDAAEFLLDEARVAAVPGGAFGVEGHMRFSFACSLESIRRGVSRMAEAVDRLE